jgi:hypothetical protein
MEIFTKFPSMNNLQQTTMDTSPNQSPLIDATSLLRAPFMPSGTDEDDVIDEFVDIEEEEVAPEFHHNNASTSSSSHGFVSTAAIDNLFNNNQKQDGVAIVSDRSNNQQVLQQHQQTCTPFTINKNINNNIIGNNTGFSNENTTTMLQGMEGRKFSTGHRANNTSLDVPMIDLTDGDDNESFGLNPGRGRGRRRARSNNSGGGNNSSILGSLAIPTVPKSSLMSSQQILVPPNVSYEQLHGYQLQQLQAVARLQQMQSGDNANLHDLHRRHQRLQMEINQLQQEQQTLLRRSFSALSNHSNTDMSVTSTNSMPPASTMKNAVLPPPVTSLQLPRSMALSHWMPSSPLSTSGRTTNSNNTSTASVLTLPPVSAATTATTRMNITTADLQLRTFQRQQQILKQQQQQQQQQQSRRFVSLSSVADGEPLPLSTLSSASLPIEPILRNDEDDDDDIRISVESPSPQVPSSKANPPIRRTRSLSSNSWNRHFQELIKFREENDHCFVPHNYPKNQKLSQWVRKQRHQRKRKDKGLHSTLSDERQELLTNAGFVWDSHKAQWQERYQSLEMYDFKYGHSNVPSDYQDSSLSNWVKNQRRQYRLLQHGLKNTLDMERVNMLNSIGFNWNPRNLGVERDDNE